MLGLKHWLGLLALAAVTAVLPLAAGADTAVLVSSADFGGDPGLLAAGLSASWDAGSGTQGSYSAGADVQARASAGSAGSPTDDAAQGALAALRRPDSEGSAAARLRIRVDATDPSKSQVELGATAEAAGIVVAHVAELRVQDAGGLADGWTRPEEEPAQPAGEDPSQIPAPDAEGPLVAQSAVSDPTRIEAAPVLVSVAVSVGAVAFAAPPNLWTRWLRLVPGLGLFTRVGRDEALDHPRRYEIYEYVRQNPGERYEVARRALGLSNGVMLHHLKILDHNNVVRTHRLGGVTRLYLAGPRVEATPYLQPLRRQLIATLGTQPGLSQGELASQLGLTARAMSYHVGWLRRYNLIEVKRDGKVKRCFPTAAVAAPGA